MKAICLSLVTLMLPLSAQAELTPDFQHWQLEWAAGFELDKSDYTETPFEWSRTHLMTRRSDPAFWYRFTAGCNAAHRQERQLTTKDGLQPPSWSIYITQTGCSELVKDGDETREITSRYSDIEIIIASAVKTNDYKPQIKMSGDQMTWLNNEGLPVAKFKKINPLANGLVWAVDRSHHTDFDAFYDANYKSQIKFYGSHVDFRLSCGASQHDVKYDNNLIEFSDETRPKACRKLTLKDGAIVEAPTYAEHLQPFQIAYDGLSKAVRYKRSDLFMGPEIPYIQFFDEAGHVVLQLTRHSKYRPKHARAYKGAWRLMGADMTETGPVIRFDDYSFQMKHSCDENIRRNIFSHHNQEIKLMSILSSTSKRQSCAADDPRYNPHQDTLDLITREASRYVVDGNKLYLANEALEIVGEFARIEG